MLKNRVFGILKYAKKIGYFKHIGQKYMSRSLQREKEPRSKVFVSDSIGKVIFCKIVKTYNYMMAKKFF